MIIEAMFTTFVSGVISGIIGNSADRTALEIKNRFIQAFNKSDKRVDILETVHNAGSKAYCFALKDICIEAFHIATESYIKLWLRNQIKTHEDTIKKAEQKNNHFPPIEGLDHTALLLSSGTNDLEKTNLGKEKIIAHALDRPELPNCYIEQVKNGLYEKTCFYFNEEIYKDKDLMCRLSLMIMMNMGQSMEDIMKYQLLILEKLDQIISDSKVHAPGIEVISHHPEDFLLEEEIYAEEESSNHPLHKLAGIVPRKALHRGMRLPGEVFAIELLTEDIFLVKAKGRIKVKIDRRNTSHAIITNEGKKNLNKKIIDDRNIHNYLLSRDREIQAYLNRTASYEDDYERVSLREQQIFLRWASGGVLPIVEYRGRKYVALFYRDKEPFGWNLFLGSSDRQFDENGKLLKDVEKEYNRPSAFIAREFEEELLVFETEPNPKKDKGKNIILPISLPYSNDESSEKFSEKHMQLRQKYDGLNIEADYEKAISCELVNTKMDLRIVDSTGKSIRPISNVLVCFNLMELGIEVIQVVKFSLEDHNVLLDGEILSGYEEELVRMPLALISCDFLNTKFKGDISHLAYTPGSNPSIEIDEAIPASEMVLFDYDLKERLKVINKCKARVGPLEEARYIASFEKYFDSSTCTIKEAYTRYFTPAAAKALNLMFEQIHPKEYSKNI